MCQQSTDNEALVPLDLGLIRMHQPVLAPAAPWRAAASSSITWTGNIHTKPLQVVCRAVGACCPTGRSRTNSTHVCLALSLFSYLPSFTTSRLSLHLLHPQTTSRVSVQLQSPSRYESRRQACPRGKSVCAKFFQLLSTALSFTCPPHLHLHPQSPLHPLHLTVILNTLRSRSGASPHSFLLSA